MSELPYDIAPPVQTGRRSTRLRRLAAAAGAGVVVVSLTTACAQITAVANGCRTPSEATQQELTSHLRSDFVAGTNRIKEVTFIDAASVALPEDLQKFGVTRVLVVRVGIFPEGVEDTAIPGASGQVYLGADDGDAVVAPMGILAETVFDYPDSEEPGWDAYGEQVFSSDAAGNGRDCTGG